MKILLKYGIIGGVLMLAATYAAITPYLKDYFDNSVSGAAMFIAMGGVNLYGINTYLKSEKTTKYNYGVGFLISLGIGLIGASTYSLVFILLNYSQHSFFVNLPMVFTRIKQFLPLIIFCSFIIPLFFTSNKNNIKSNNDDILDSDFTDSN